MRLPVRDTRVAIPSAKLHVVQMKLAPAGKLCQEFVAADAHGFHLQNPRGDAAQSLRDPASPRQLRQVDTIQFRRNLIDGARQKLRIYFFPHFAARPLHLSFTDVELQIMERALSHNLFQLQFFDPQLRYAQLAFRIYTADEFASRQARRGSSQESWQQPLQPVRPRSWTNPAIEVLGLELVRVQMKIPLRPILHIGLSPFLNISCPRSAKPFNSHHARDAPPVDPIQRTFGYFQRLA